MKIKNNKLDECNNLLPHHTCHIDKKVYPWKIWQGHYCCKGCEKDL